MNYYSTKNKNHKKSFREALFLGLAEDGGLFMPEFIPKLEKEYLEKLNAYSIQEIAYSITRKYIDSEIDDFNLNEIINKTLNFNSPLLQLNKNIYLLELFHGPTLAFKDYGARFMANIMSYFISKYENKEINILVATSGDTGSAVASAFYNLDGIKITILFPKDKVSKIQELQLTTYGKNIEAFEVDGTFDDCQKLVKAAFMDDDLKFKYNLTSANSINIARLIPQSFYYFEAAIQLNNSKPLIFSVPSGNLGNLTGGIIAKKMGLNVKKIISATNINSVFTEYINKGIYNPRNSTLTISNAMDVGDPSNFERVQSVFYNYLEMIDLIESKSFTDVSTKKIIEEVFLKFNYILDPHGAVAFLATQEFINSKDYNIISLLTAHPAKFYNIVKEIIKIDFTIPNQILALEKKAANKKSISSDFNDFKKVFCNY